MGSEPQPKIHLSIRKGFSVPSLQKCHDCCVPAKYHCPFCSPTHVKPSKCDKMKDHLDNHLKRAFFLGEYTIHRCGLECRTQPHYHCLYCADTMTTKIDLTNHLPLCIKAQQKKRLTLLDRQLTLRLSRRASRLSRREKVTPSNDMESEEDSDEMAVDSELNSAKSHQSVQTDFEKPQDCDEHYFMTLAKVFKKMSPQKKTAIRMKIERLLFEAEFQ